MDGVLDPGPRPRWFCVGGLCVPPATSVRAHAIGPDLDWLRPGPELLRDAGRTQSGYAFTLGSHSITYRDLGFGRREGTADREHPSRGFTAHARP